MYRFLCHVNHEIMPGRNVGSCTNPRFVYSSGSSLDTDWTELRSDLLGIIQEYFYNENVPYRQDSLKAATEKIIRRLVKGKRSGKSEFCGVGAMGANQFVHLCSLLGLLPLYCFNVSILMDPKLGPGALVMKCFGKPSLTLGEVKHHFESISSELKSIWGDMITDSLLENTFCEVMRSVRATSDKLGYQKISEMPVLKIIDDEVRVESEKRDIVYFDEGRKSMQNMFLVTSSGSSATCLRPCLVMKDSSSWSDGSKSCINLTNWCGSRNKKDKGLIKWSETGIEMRLSSSLEVSTTVSKLMSII